jgi:hypothetical protein
VARARGYPNGYRELSPPFPRAKTRPMPGTGWPEPWPPPDASGGGGLPRIGETICLSRKTSRTIGSMVFGTAGVVGVGAWPTGIGVWNRPFAAGIHLVPELVFIANSAPIDASRAGGTEIPDGVGIAWEEATMRSGGSAMLIYGRAGHPRGGATYNPLVLGPDDGLPSGTYSGRLWRPGCVG